MRHRVQRSLLLRSPRRIRVATRSIPPQWHKYDGHGQVVVTDAGTTARAAGRICQTRKLRLCRCVSGWGVALRERIEQCRRLAKSPSSQPSSAPWMIRRMSVFEIRMAVDRRAIRLPVAPHVSTKAWVRRVMRSNRTPHCATSPPIDFPGNWMRVWNAAAARTDMSNWCCSRRLSSWVPCARRWASASARMSIPVYK